MQFPAIHLTATDLALIGKLFLNLANSIPAPREGCSDWTAFGYDFIQNLASNRAKVGERRSAQGTPEIKHEDIPTVS